MFSRGREKVYWEEMGKRKLLSFVWQILTTGFVIKARCPLKTFFCKKFIFLEKTFVANTSLLLWCSLWGIQLLRYHKISKIWTPLRPFLQFW